MTITKTQWRIKDGYTSPIDILSSTLASALESLVIYELGYGGSVIDITPTRVQVITNVMGCEDHTIFEGKEREMQPLVEISALFLKCSFNRLIGKEERNEYEDKYLELVSERVLKITKGSPLLIDLGSGMIIGDFTLKAVIIQTIYDLTYLNETQLGILSNTSTKDLFTVYSLIKADSIPVREALSLVL